MKRLLAVLLSVAMIFVFSSCNNTNEPSDENQAAFYSRMEHLPPKDMEYRLNLVQLANQEVKV